MWQVIELTQNVHLDHLHPLITLTTLATLMKAAQFGSPRWSPTWWRLSPILWHLGGWEVDALVWQGCCSAISAVHQFVQIERWQGGAGFKIHRAQWGRRNFCRQEVDKTDHIIIPNKDALSSDQIFEFTLKSLDPSGHVLPATLGPTPIQLEPALYL